jgi:hypothetical protein
VFVTGGEGVLESQMGELDFPPGRLSRHHKGIIRFSWYETTSF